MAVEVERIETSCHCVRVEPMSLSIEPGESTTLTVSFDPSEDPDFRGGLAVEVLGKDRDDDVLFRTRVDLTVRSASATPPPASNSADAASNGPESAVLLPG